MSGHVLHRLHSNWGWNVIGEPGCGICLWVYLNSMNHHHIVEKKSKNCWQFTVDKYTIGPFDVELE